ncbi:MAG: 6-phosphofructokinase [Piptocephalis tieghemiana]|nr:MAG: 6-phosphofructokinase [Piptocephalis tieghemiana]
MPFPHTSLSYITLRAPSKELVAQTVQYYSQLGFQVIRQHKPTSVEPHTAVWLQQFPVPSNQNVHTSKGLTPLLPPGQPLLTLEVTTLPSESQDLSSTSSATPLTLHLSLPRDPVTEKASPASSRSPSPPPTASPSRDPLGNEVLLSNGPNPFTSLSPTQTSLSAVTPILTAARSATCSRDCKKAKSHHHTGSSEDHGTKSSSSSPSTKHIGILTSGGDAAGMNAAVRSVVRMAISEGCVPYIVVDGYQGLVDGGGKIRRVRWNDVRGYLHLGGTAIGTARCMAFKERPGRLTAAHNLVSRGIDSLVVIGGDGSLTGADIFREEWPSLLEELVSTKRLTEKEALLHKHLTIVGMVGSIDNDMSSTDLTIGALSSMHRICEAVDAITTTASSHSRAFVVEVMGRHCGWLALNAAISTGADYCFIPERPPPIDWPSRLCTILKRNRGAGKRRSIIIICEGAIDQNLRPIKANEIKKVLEDGLHLDTRVTLLGHVQRGGSPCANDRVLATLQGVEAVRAVLDSKPDTPSPLIGVSENKITSTPLMSAVSLTHEVAKAIEKKDFGRAMELRDPEFSAVYDAYRRVTLEEELPLGDDKDSSLDEKKDKRSESPSGPRVGIMHVGAPAGGMNAATRVAARLLLSAGACPVAISNGFAGLANGEFRDLSWMDVDGWMARGGSDLGTNRMQPDDLGLGRVAFRLQELGLKALLVIGGFEAYTALLSLSRVQNEYPILGMPMVHLPATVSNNCPGTEYSLGCDTALNAIVNACDCIKQSATASRRRVFVVEVQGGRCGYLALTSAIAVGATCVYTPEAGITLRTLSEDVEHLINLYAEKGGKGRQGSIVLRTEEASSTYTTNMIANVFKEEAMGLFDARTAVLGHIQQGGAPSPLDRMRATRMAAKCVDWILEWLDHPRDQEARDIMRGQSSASSSSSSSSSKNQSCPPPYQNTESPAVWGRKVSETSRRFRQKGDNIVVIGIQKGSTVFTAVETLVASTDMVNRRSNCRSWWQSMDRLVHIFGKYGMDNEVEEVQGEGLLGGDVEGLGEVGVDGSFIPPALRSPHFASSVGDV